MKKWIARWFLRLTGWQVEGQRPEHSRYILIAAPHTSNWDFPYMLAFAAVCDIEVTWLAKHSLFVGPMGWFMRAMGGVPVVRHKNRNLVATLVESFEIESKLALLVPTEGTRRRVEYWKSGFYHIARHAGVPIVPSFLDFGSKRGGFGPALTTTDDMRSDMQYFRDFYHGMSGKYPNQFGPVKLKEEENSAN